MKKIKLKKVVLFLIVIISFQSYNLSAQSLFEGKNIIKTTLTDLPFNQYSVTYERALGRLFSLSFSYKYGPEQNIPILSNIASAVGYNGDNNLNIFDLTYSSHTTQIQGRFYVGLGKMKGFYIAPYFRFANFNVKQPVKFSYNVPVSDGFSINIDTTDIMKGNADAFSFGAAIGYQWQILNKIVIDFSIIGGGYGQINANFESQNSYQLNQNATTALENELNQKLSSLTGYTFKNEIDNNTNKINSRISGPWYSLIILNLAIGIRF